MDIEWLIKSLATRPSASLPGGQQWDWKSNPLILPWSFQCPAPSRLPRSCQPSVNSLAYKNTYHFRDSKDFRSLCQEVGTRLNIYLPLSHSISRVHTNPASLSLLCLILHHDFSCGLWCWPPCYLPFTPPSYTVNTPIERQFQSNSDQNLLGFSSHTEKNLKSFPSIWTYPQRAL